jgi:hypothetical protein
MTLPLPRLLRRRGRLDRIGIVRARGTELTFYHQTLTRPIRFDCPASNRRTPACHAGGLSGSGDYLAS